MLNILESVAVTLIKAPISCADTAAASTWSGAIPASEGVVLVHIGVGVITGTVDFTFTTNTAASDAGATTIVPIGGALAQITTSNDVAFYLAAFPATQLRGFLKVVGTVGTGPAILSYSVITIPKYAS